MRQAADRNFPPTTVSTLPRKVCENVIIRGITVNSTKVPSGDGIDIESCKNVLIEYCTLNCGDDCFTLKAGRAEDGIRDRVM